MNYVYYVLSTKPPVSPSVMYTSIHHTQTPKPFINILLTKVPKLFNQITNWGNRLNCLTPTSQV